MPIIIYIIVTNLLLLSQSRSHETSVDSLINQGATIQREQAYPNITREDHGNNVHWLPACQYLLQNTVSDLNIYVQSVPSVCVSDCDRFSEQI